MGNGLDWKAAAPRGRDCGLPFRRRGRRDGGQMWQWFDVIERFRCNENVF
jgi:hypothetical protein